MNGSLGRSAYAEANAAAERDTLALAGPGFTACAVRQATVFGVSPRMRLDLVVHQMVVQARSRRSIPVLGDGLQWRPFVHLADVCEAMLLLLRGRGWASSRPGRSPMAREVAGHRRGSRRRRRPEDDDRAVVPAPAGLGREQPVVLAGLRSAGGAARPVPRLRSGQGR